MYPCSLRIRASSTLNRECGIATESWSAASPLRIRVRKSPIGSVIVIGVGLLPARLREPGHVAIVRHLPQADPAEAELAEVGARPTAAPAAVVVPALELLRPRLAHDL